MHRLFLSGLSLAGLVIAAWASYSAPSAKREPAEVKVPHYFGAIHPRISTDGRQIAFSFQGAIWRGAQDGGTITRLTDGAGFDIEPAWSPDEARIAYVNAPRMAGGGLRII